MDIKISDLHITSNDPWKDAWVENHGDSVFSSPEYYYYKREGDKLKDWPLLSRFHRVRRMELVWDSIMEWGQIEDIEVDGNRIISGHKRAAAMAVLGHDFIGAVQTKS